MRTVAVPPTRRARCTAMIRTGATWCCSTSTSMAMMDAVSAQVTRPAGLGLLPSSCSRAAKRRAAKQTALLNARNVRRWEIEMPLPALIVETEFLRDLDAALDREWLETNGLGGFASSTVIGLNTRRYHGLLTAATKPPVGRIVLLSKLEEVAIIGDRRYELGANRYPGAVHPRGHTLLKEFRLDPFPTWTWDLDGVGVCKRVFM